MGRTALGLAACSSARPFPKCQLLIAAVLDDAAYVALVAANCSLHVSLWADNQA
jgi:hypothetical protein